MDIRVKKIDMIFLLFMKTGSRESSLLPARIQLD